MLVRFPNGAVREMDAEAGQRLIDAARAEEVQPEAVETKPEENQAPQSA